MTPVFAAWLVEVGIIGVRDLSQSRRLPVPSELLATFVVFGALGLVAESSTFRQAANVTAWGIVIATLLSSKVDFLSPVGEFFGGKGIAPASPQPLSEPFGPGGSFGRTAVA